MTVHKLSAGDGYAYLTQQVASADEHRSRGQDLADYYTETGNPPGRWAGAGAAELGMAGTVAEAQMRALFGRGEHPDAAAIARRLTAAGESELAVARATRLGRRFPKYRSESVADGSPDRRAVAGYDLVFTPVKSASLLWALGGEHARNAVEAAHAEAVTDVIRWLERHAAFTRVGDGGPAQIDTRGLICAAFDHRDSRAGDPDLHTHVAVSNKVRARQDAPDGNPRWLALDGRALFHAGVAASERYNTRFEDALTQRLGVAFAPRADAAGRDRRAVREIVGVPDRLIRLFSQRRQDIESRYAELAASYTRNHGRQPDGAAAIQLAQQATLETRQAKAPARPLGRMLNDWRAQAVAEVGQPAVDDLLANVTWANTPPDPIDIEGLARDVLLVVEGHRATWTRWNLTAEIERQTRHLRFADPGDRERLVDAVLARATSPDQAVSLAPPPLLDEPAELRREDGSSVFVPHGSQRWTSQRVLDAEQRLLAAATTRTDLAVDDTASKAAIDRFEALARLELHPDQRRLAHAFATDPNLLVVGIGPAGTGKTTAMRAACAVWSAAGRRVVPLAASSKAAEVLGAELELRAENLHKFVFELTRDLPEPADTFFRLQQGDVVLVDEAGMAGTGNLDRLVAHATAAGAQVRLLGDPHQLAAVESGGVLRLIAADVGAVELTGVHRFTDPAEAEATLQLRAGDQNALGFYLARGRVHGGGREEMLEAAYDGWRADVTHGRRAVLVAATNTDVSALSARARLDRVALGQVEPDGVPLHDGTRAGRGDWIVTRRNDRTTQARGGRDFVKNGDAWQVQARHDDGSLTVTHLGHGGRVRLSPEYAARHVELAYATTVHRVQGLTVDTAHALVTDASSRESLYVAATRASTSTTLYVACEPDGDTPSDAVRREERAPRQVLEAVLARQAAELSATETRRRVADEARSLATLVPALEHARGLARRLGDDPRWQEWQEYLHRREALIDRRIDELVARTCATQPSWAFGLLSSSDASALRQAVAYRDRYGVGGNDPLHPLGPEPDGHTDQHRAWLAAREAAARRVGGANAYDPSPTRPRPADPRRRTRRLTA